MAIAIEKPTYCCLLDILTINQYNTNMVLFV